MQIAINSDQTGFDLKEYLKSCLIEANFDVKDFSEAQDYYDNTLKAVQEFVVGGYDRAILIHQNVYAAAILANRFPGVRAAVCNDAFTARKMVTYGNANVAVLDSQGLDPQKAWDLVRIWTAGQFSREYLAEHNQQLDIIEEIDQSLLRSDWKSTLQMY